jgi:hypothetical protein
VTRRAAPLEDRCGVAAGGGPTFWASQVVGKGVRLDGSGRHAALPTRTVPRSSPKKQFHPPEQVEFAAESATPACDSRRILEVAAPEVDGGRPKAPRESHKCSTSPSQFSGLLDAVSVLLGHTLTWEFEGDPGRAFPATRTHKMARTCDSSGHVPCPSK